ncbi:MAG TPA: hypothetical protein VHJ20_07160 [Polyangia bacterium]|nr:hypothetical protein [Polyangia bacterium]
MKMRNLFITAALAGLGAGCSEYKYVDVHVVFDPTMYDITSTQVVTTCQVTVTGAASGKFSLPQGICPNRTNSGDALDAGTFEFSTFASSGTINFQVDTYTGQGFDPNCITGTGTTPVMVTSPSMLKGTVTIAKTGKAACTNVTPPTSTVDSGT